MSQVPYHAFDAVIGDSKRKASEIKTDCYLANPYNWLPTYEEQRVKVSATWDTGATDTFISRELARRLGSPVHRKVSFSTATGPVTAHCYEVLIELPNKFADFVQVLALESDEDDEDDVLIGMDIIAKGDMAICGGKLFSFCSPSLPKPINLSDEAKIANRNDRK